jgi:hypothetical protein
MNKKRGEIKKEGNRIKRGRKGRKNNVPMSKFSKTMLEKNEKPLSRTPYFIHAL